MIFSKINLEGPKIGVFSSGQPRTPGVPAVSSIFALSHKWRRTTMFSQGGWLPIPLLQSLDRGREEACSTCFPLKRHYLPSVPPKCRQPPTQEHASEIKPVTSHDLMG